ncbi:DNA primase [Erythrobacter sp. EC-HK427]|uniref:DNA primase n=1 Tax=Erythrobacter sp. EC-HK427 TaxID=2038396 RepID=UPI0012516969|nr:DNA primase [Erythrobacter sp. EC-HK427]VVT15157.1 DNA primase [Erythrobacter sp. EC-HK427]
MLTPQWLDELKSRITLSSLVQKTVNLQRAGREWKACCPFHNEATPSFYVNDQKGFYHCFGCQAHGSAIDWMIEQRGLQFMDAVKELAAEAGMEVPAPDPRAAERAEKRASLHDVMQAAQDWFVARLASDEGVGARRYLEKRGLSQRMIEQFGFGYAPDDKLAIKQALSQFDEAMLVEAGLLIAVDDKLPYARFRGRLMLPIQDARGRVIAFGGRILESRDGIAKYLNSPDTPLFDKGRTLYNIHRAGAASRKTERVIAVEGYMDVIALAQAGFEDVVAPMGTALTETQVELLWRMADKPVLCFDGDAAGQRAAMRAAERTLPLLRPGHSLQIVQLPAGLDPDDLVKQRGAAAMETLLARPKSLLDLIWEHEREAQPLTSPEDKAGLKERLLDHVAAIQHPDIKSLYKRELLDLYGRLAFPQREFKKREWTQKRSTNIIDFVEEKRRRDALKHSAALTKQEQYLRNRLGSALTAGLLRRPYLIPAHAADIFAIPEVELDPRLRLLIEAWQDGLELDPITMGAVLKTAGQELPKPEDYGRLRFTFVWPRASDDDAEKSLEKGVGLYAGLPEWKELLARVNASFEQDLRDEIYVEQQRLRAQVEDFLPSIRKLLVA